MLVIHYPTAFRALDLFVDAYNAKADKNCSKLRTGAVMTAKEIIRIYGISLLKANGVSPLDPGNLPSLQTNNKQLARFVKCSSRTVQRHIVKLLQAGIIKAKSNHGSNSNYELWMSPEILLIKQRISVDKANEQLQRSLQECKQIDSGSAFLDSPATKCPHTYSGYIKNNVIIDVKTVEKKFSNSLNPEKSAGYTAGNTGEIDLKKFEEQNFRGKNVAEKNYGTGEIASRADQPENLSVSSDPARDNSLNLFVSLFWLTAKNLLYKDTFLTENQVQIAKSLIRKLYEPSTAENISNHHQAYIERLSLVHKYLQRDQKRFIPLPYIYFNLNNPHGFIATKAWHRKDRARKREVARELTLFRLIRKYTNNEKQPPARRKPSLELFRKYENTLSKLGGAALSRRFCAAVIEHESYSQIARPNSFHNYK